MGSVGEAAGGRGSCIRSSARQVSRMSTEGEAAPAAETPAEGEPLPEEGSGLPPACMDLTDFLLKIDDFEKVDALDEKAERMENCPNYRQVNGFPIYGTGQPSEAGYQKVLEKVSTAAGEGVNKMIWFNMRKQVAWKALILNFMERYFYLICFATYALEHGPGGYQKAFTTWMDEHKELRT